MSDLSDLSALTIPLALTAHQQAKSFQRHHTAPAVQKRVYLNTLAVYAVATYLEQLGYDVDFGTSNSHNPAQQALMDVADLQVAAAGRLECRPVLPEQSYLSIPAEVAEDRAAYLAVQLDESLRKAKILGFASTVPVASSDYLSIPLADLHPPEDLGSYLEQLIAEPAPIRLGQWLQSVTQAGWQMLSDTSTGLLPAASPAFAFRSSSQLPAGEEHPQPSIGQCKPLTLQDGEEDITVNLLVGLIPQPDDDLEIWIQLSPAEGQTQLPYGLKLMVLDAAEETVMQAEARRTEALQLKFVAALGERFSLRVLLGDSTTTETFAV
jgi:hypothetical protein